MTQEKDELSNIELVSPPLEDPTKFTDRSFACVWNEGHSIRLISREGCGAISIPWEDIAPLRTLLSGTMPDTESSAASNNSDGTVAGSVQPPPENVPCIYCRRVYDGNQYCGKRRGLQLCVFPPPTASLPESESSVSPARVETDVDEHSQLPWKRPALLSWSIVGMNHYHVNGEQRLFVAMTKGLRCIQAEGSSEEGVFSALEIEAARQLDAYSPARDAAVEGIVEALKDCAQRMEKLRELLKVSGAPDAQWNILDTKESHTALALYEAQRGKQ